jgi:hypothetical protein
MFRSRLEALMAEQRARLEAIVSSDVVDEAYEFLDLHDLSVDSIDKSLCAELKIVLSRRNDVQIDMSNRLNKYGWSSARILDHMLKVFYAKTQAIGRVLKAFLDSRDPESALEGYEGPKNVLSSEDASEANVEIGKAYKFASGLDFELD